MFIWGVPSVEDQPSVTLIRWRVLRIKAKKMSIDLVLGWCLEDGHARMSTPIVCHSPEARTLTTKSGRVYVVQGAPDYDDDAQFIAEEHFGRAAGKAIDVSDEYFDDSLLTEAGNPPNSERIITPDFDVSLPGAESRQFMLKTDRPFQPNMKLAKAIKRTK